VASITSLSTVGVDLEVRIRANAVAGVVELRHHEDAVGGDVNGSQCDHAGLAVDAAALIPPALVARVELHDQHVAPAENRRVGGIEAGAGVAAVLAVDLASVQPVAAVVKHAVELQPNAVVLRARGDAKLPSIDRWLDRQKGVAPEPIRPPAFVHGGILGDKGALDHIIMRHVHATPGAVVVIGGDRLGRLAKMKAPALVERLHDARRSGGRDRVARAGVDKRFHRAPTGGGESLETEQKVHHHKCAKKARSGSLHNWRTETYCFSRSGQRVSFVNAKERMSAISVPFVSEANFR
jgi:hypothetical protein